MPKLLDNKQIIHIVSEIVILIALTFYFSSKNKTLMSHIEELAQRLEEQENQIQKQNQLIQQLGNVVGNLQQSFSSLSITPQPSVYKQRVKRPVKRSNRKTPVVVESVQPLNDMSYEKRVRFDVEELDNDDENDEDNDNEDESDLDNDISAEIEELDSESSLKKQ